MYRIILEFLWGERMTFVSLTRLRIRSFRFVPLFALHTWRSLRQVRSAPGFQTGAILADRNWTFWTMTAWDSEESMRQFMLSGSHKTAMPHLVEWCDEASVAHWTQQEALVPSWIEADRRMREGGHSSKVRNPSPKHATLAYRAPRTIAGAKITRSWFAIDNGRKSTADCLFAIPGLKISTCVRCRSRPGGRHESS
jgi:heme-degrading monooxygenase HmoA